MREEDIFLTGLAKFENRSDVEIDEADAEPNDGDDGGVPDYDNDCSSEIEDPRILKDDEVEPTD